MPSSPLRIVFTVLGEGRGHMTQAIAARDILEDAGHQVIAVFLGDTGVHPIPAYFQDRMQIPLTTFPAPTLVPDRRLEGMSVGRTALHNLTRFPSFLGSFRGARDRLRALRPHVVVNFFDLISGFVQLGSRRPAPPPTVAIAHCYLMRHPGAATAPPGALARAGLNLLGKTVAVGCPRPLALSFDELPDTPGVRVLPPLLRRGLDGREVRDEGFLLVYALTPGYALEVAGWQSRNPGTEVHCYIGGGGRVLDLRRQEGFHLHGLDDTRFVDHLTRCRAYAGTAGFEAVCEAHYLGKPVLAVPVARHYEQAFNAADMNRTGVARVGSFGDLDSFWKAPPVPDRESVGAFRRWVARAPELLVQAVEEAAAARIGVTRRVSTGALGPPP